MGTKGIVTKGAILRSPGTKYKHSKNVFAFTSIALTLVTLGTQLLKISAQFFIGSPDTSLVHRASGFHGCCCKP